MKMMMHGKGHWACCAKPALKAVFWLAAALCLAMAWVAVYRKDLVLGLEPLAWYWNALVLGVLANGLKGHGYWHMGSEEGKSMM